MARYLVYTTPARGHLYPVIPALEELRRRGHQIAIRTLSAEVSLLQGLGFSAAPVDPSIEQVRFDDFHARTPFGVAQRLMEHIGEQARLSVPDCQGAIEEEQPDAVVVDMRSFGAAFASEASGLPWAYYSVSVPEFPSRDAPPSGPGLAPRHDLVGRLRDRTVSALRTLTVRGKAREYLEPLRAQLDLPPRRGITEYVRAGQVAVFYTAEPFEYPRSDWPSNVRLVGPGIWDPPAEPPEWLGQAEAPIVLVSTSTDFEDNGRLIDTALQALAGEDVVVIATSPLVDPETFSVPANARVERFAPHGPILPRATCVVSHGGYGISQKALAAGVPVCVVPFGRDHFETARRVEVCGAGTRLPARRLNPDSLRQAVREAIGKREGARRIAAAFEEAGGAPAAADAYEELLGRTSS